MRQQRKHLDLLNIPDGPREQFFTEDESTLLDRLCGFPQEENAHRDELCTANELDYGWLETERYHFH